MSEYIGENFFQRNVYLEPTDVGLDLYAFNDYLYELVLISSLIGSFDNLKIITYNYDSGFKEIENIKLGYLSEEDFILHSTEQAAYESVSHKYTIYYLHDIEYTFKEDWEIRKNNLEVFE